MRMTRKKGSGSGRDYEHIACNILLYCSPIFEELQGIFIFILLQTYYEN